MSITSEPITYRDIVLSLRQLEISPDAAVLVHADIDRFGAVRGGADTFNGVLLSTFSKVLMPAFTHQTVVVPGIGPQNNAIQYGSGVKANLQASFFHKDQPVDENLGALPEALRRHQQAQRSGHPILSFTGVNAGRYLDTQTIEEPLAPIGRLADERGWVLLLGTDHTQNASIHWAERIAGRKQFVRWALTPQGVVECPGMPGCSQGFGELAERLEGKVRSSSLNGVVIQAVRVRDVVETARLWIEADAGALLCANQECEYCP